MYPNTTASSRLHKNIRKNRKIERNGTHGIKWNKPLRSNTRQKMTPPIVLICNKEIFQKRHSLTMSATRGCIFLKSRLICTFGRAFRLLIILKWYFAIPEMDRSTLKLDTLKLLLTYIFTNEAWKFCEIQTKFKL